MKCQCQMCFHIYCIEILHQLFACTIFICYEICKSFPHFLTRVLEDDGSHLEYFWGCPSLSSLLSLSWSYLTEMTWKALSWQELTHVCLCIQQDIAVVDSVIQCVHNLVLGCSLLSMYKVINCSLFRFMQVCCCFI